MKRLLQVFGRPQTFKINEIMKSQPFYCLPLLILLLACAFPGNTKEQIVKVEVYEVSEIFFSYISCDDFEKRTDLIHYIVEDPKIINRVIGYLNTAYPAPEFKNNVDVRRKVLLFHESGKVDTICMAYTNTILVNGMSKQIPSPKYSWETFNEIADTAYISHIRMQKGN